MAGSNPRAQGTNPRARAAVRVQLLELAIDQALDLLGEGNVEDARRTLHAALVGGGST